MGFLYFHKVWSSNLLIIILRTGGPSVLHKYSMESLCSYFLKLFCLYHWSIFILTLKLTMLVAVKHCMPGSICTCPQQSAGLCLQPVKLPTALFGTPDHLLPCAHPDLTTYWHMLLQKEVEDLQQVICLFDFFVSVRRGERSESALAWNVKVDLCWRDLLSYSV